MNIQTLLTRYFEGETSAEDERRLRAFFASNNVPPELQAYKPLFAYFDQEIAKETKKPRVGHRKIYYFLSAVAASALLFLLIHNPLTASDPCFCSDSYVVVNGRCYTDIEKVRAFAFEAMREVATPAEDYFISEDGDAIAEQLVENQWKELRNLFSDDQ